MPYVPPPSSDVVVELASAGYTPPSAVSLTTDLAVEEGDPTGTTTFINASGALSLTGNPPIGTTLSHPVPVSALTLAAYAPVSYIFLASVIDAPGQLSITPLPLTLSASNTADQAALTLGAYTPTYFKGITQSIAAQGSLSVTAPSSLITAAALTGLPAETVQVTAQPINASATHTIAPTPSLSVSPLAGLVQRQLIRYGVDSAYSSPDITLDVSGSLTLTAVAPTYAIRVRNEVEVPCGLLIRLVSDIIGAYTARVSAEAESSYAVRGVLAAATEVLYSIKNTDRVLSAVEGGYRFPIVSEVESMYSIVESVRVATAYDSIYAVVQASTARNGIDSLYSSLTNVRIVASADSLYNYATVISVSADALYSLTSPVQEEKVSTYTLEATARARGYIDAIYSSPESQIITITEPPYVLYKGRRLGVEEAEISMAEGDYAWTCTVVLSRLDDYAQLRQDQPFSVVFGAERYEFIVDSKELDRSNPANYGMKLMGVSPSAVFASPRMQSLSSMWDTVEQASSIADELLSGVSWGVVDWAIPAYRFALRDITPVEAVQTLAEAVGAVLETSPEGALYVRSRYPISTEGYASATPAHVLVEATDILTVQESYVSSTVFNRLVVTDIEQEVSDSLEWLEDYTGATTGTIRAYLYPWRSAVSLLHTGISSVTIAAPNTVLTRHEEIIEVFQGQGDAAYPIHHVEAITYEAQNTGGIIFDPDSRSFTVGGPSFNSVIRLVYWTRSLDYRVSMADARPTQFLLESAPL